jgi:anti-sigma B factor antagonist
VFDASGRWQVTLAGEIDTATMPRLDEIAEEITDADPADVFVDLTKVTFLLSTGLGFLADLRTHATAGGYTVTLHSPTTVALRALQIVGFDRVFPITVD